MKNLNAAPKAQFFTTAGIPLVGGKLYTYVAGTSTPQATYTTEAGVTANTNPIILDTRGECNLFLTESVSYKFILYDSTDVLIWSVDNISSLSGLATQAANAVAITGGTISGVTITGGTISGLTSPLPIASGGTNAITAAAARTSLGLGTYAVVNVPTASAANVLLGDAISTVAPGTTGNLLTSTSTAWASTAPAAEVFGANGTVVTTTGVSAFTIPAGVTRMKVTIIGGGAGGAGCSTLGGGGGGAGSTATSFLTSLTPGSTLEVTVGTGGAGGAAGSNDGVDGVNSTLATGTTGTPQTITTITAGKGLKGLITGSGGSGGTASGGTGQIVLNGGGGGGTGTSDTGGTGGASSMGGGGVSLIGATAQTGLAYGSGGGGGGDVANPRAGGAGKQGIVIFEW
jgi:hypothetical protein